MITDREDPNKHYKRARPAGSRVTFRMHSQLLGDNGTGTIIGYDEVLAEGGLNGYCHIISDRPLAFRAPNQHIPPLTEIRVSVLDTQPITDDEAQVRHNISGLRRTILGVFGRG